MDPPLPEAGNRDEGMTVTVTTFELNDSWRRWVAENYLLGTGADAMVDVLVGEGLAEPDARAELDRVRADGNLVPAGWMVQRLRKLESLLEAQQRMRALDSAYAVVPWRTGLTRQEFLTEYYAANRPVVLTDLADRWPARERWTSDFLVDRVGAEVVE
jgi:hypothetical protein